MTVRIDAHHHFWKFVPDEFPWISEDMSILRRDFLPDRLFQELEKQNIQGTVAVQARQSVEETRWLLKLARQNNFIKGVVGWVDLCSPLLEEQLEEFVKDPKFIGVRHVVHDEPDDNFMVRPDFQRGIGILSKYNLTYDLLIFPKHLSLATKLVSRFPGQPFVLDHIAKPNIRSREKMTWEKHFAGLSQFSNVYCKLSGMVTEADWNNWKPDDFNYYLNTALKYFGPDRLMFGSDWPVCILAGSYEQVVNLVEHYFANISPEIVDKIMGQNCRKLYNLKYC